MKSKLSILSLGCPRNLVDSESILGRLAKRYAVVDMQKADVALVNTCSFIEEAKKESIDAILDLIALKKQGKLKKIIVYGCLPQRYKETLRKQLPEVDAFVGSVSLNHSPKRFALTPRHYAYLKICEGCINACSFCAIPKIKGRFNSMDIDSILDKVEIFNQDKVAELNIIGQDITGFGRDLAGKPPLAKLLEKIIKKAKNISWVRLLYLYPTRISDELLRVIRDTAQVCKYIDLPIQHINDRILKLMQRGMLKKDILNIIAKIRKTIPAAALRTSIITGFPSERDEQFKELLDFLREARFERLGAFIYSREELTPAYNFKQQLPHKVKVERFNQIMSLQQEVSFGTNKKFLHRIIDVLVDEDEGDSYLGRTQYDAPEVDGQVFLKSKRKLKAGDLVKARITDTLEYDLVGEVL